MSGMVVLLFVISIVLQTNFVAIHGQCNNPQTTVAGMLGMTVNIVLQGDDGLQFVSSAWDIAYDNPSNVWFNPYKNRTECYPTQAFYQDLDISTTDQDSNIVKSFTEYITQETSNLHISAGFNAESVNISYTFQKTRERIDNWTAGSEYDMAHFKRTFAQYQMEINTLKYQPNALVLGLLESLPVCVLPHPECIAQNCQAIDLLGTHAVWSVTMGSSLNITIAYSSEFEQYHGSEWTSTQAGLTVQFFGQQAGITYGKNVSWNDIDEKFRSSAAQHIGIIGGDPTAFDAGGISKWAPTALSHPAFLIFDSGLMPIYKLIPATTQDNLTRRQNLRTILLEYIQSGGTAPCAV